MRVLCIDTAGPTIGIGVFGPGLAVQELARIQHGADAWLSVKAAEMLAFDPELVAVSVGPGAFTSLRVGVATAAGLAFARGLGVVGLSSLQVRGGEGILALLDARKSRAYARWGDLEADLPPEEAVRLPGGPFLASGEGALAFREIVENAGGTVMEGAGEPPLARLAALARSLPAAPPESLELNYIRPSDARLPGFTKG